MKKLLTILITIFIFVGCTADSNFTKPVNKDDKQNAVLQSQSPKTSNFKGNIGDFIAIKNNKITLNVNDINDGKAHFYNTTLANGNPVYFFVVKSPDGKLRAAANGCQSCGPALQGFRQEGDNMICNTCGNSFHLNKVSFEKGGCNPAPIDPDLKIKDEKIELSLEQLENIEQYFK